MRIKSSIIYTKLMLRDKRGWVKVKNEGTRRARKLRLDKFRSRKESSRISAENFWKVIDSGWMQVTKESGQTKGVGKADRTRHTHIRWGGHAW